MQFQPYRPNEIGMRLVYPKMHHLKTLRIVIRTVDTKT